LSLREKESGESRRDAEGAVKKTRKRPRRRFLRGSKEESLKASGKPRRGRRVLKGQNINN